MLLLHIDKRLLVATYMIDRSGNMVQSTSLQNSWQWNLCRNFSINLLVGKLFYCWSGFSIQSVPWTASIISSTVMVHLCQVPAVKLQYSLMTTFSISDVCLFGPMLSWAIAIHKFYKTTQQLDTPFICDSNFQDTLFSQSHQNEHLYLWIWNIFHLILKLLNMPGKLEQSKQFLTSDFPAV